MRFLNEAAIYRYARRNFRFPAADKFILLYRHIRRRRRDCIWTGKFGNDRRSDW